MMVGSKNISVCYGCKNREENLLVSIKSIINNDYINDIVVVDFNSDRNVRNFLNDNISEKLFKKLNVIEINDNVPWILSYCYNIGFSFAKNERILKLDADYVLDNRFIHHLQNDCDDSEVFYAFDWQDFEDKNDNRRHCNGLFYVTKSQLNKTSYFNHKICFYGHDDCDLKDKLSQKFKWGKLNKNTLSYITHIDCNDKERVSSSGHTIEPFEIAFDRNINFFGYNLKECDAVSTLILYNQLMMESEKTITSEHDVKSLYTISDDWNNYKRINLNFENLKLHTTNINPVRCELESVCKFDVFNKMKKVKDAPFWANEGSVVSWLIDEYKIKSYELQIGLFVLFNFTLLLKQKKEVSNTNLIISLYNEKNEIRIFELLMCLYENLKNKYISKIHILLETSDESYLIKTVLELFMQKNDYLKDRLIIKTITKRPSYNCFFDYVDNNIIGTTIIANSDIIFDKSLIHLKYLKDDDFISITRTENNKRNEILSLYTENKEKRINVFSQDAWVFKSPMKYKVKNEIEPGTMQCDSYLNYTLSKTNYKCYNLCNDINLFHVQCDQYGSVSKAIEQKNEVADIWEINNKRFTDYENLGLLVNSLNDFIEKKNNSKFVDWNNFYSGN